MNKLWAGKYKTRRDYDRGGFEVSIGGVWVRAETCAEPTFNYEEAEKLYGKEVADEIQSTFPLTCQHRYVFDGIEDGLGRYKCHECKHTYIDEARN